ncbi:MAG: polysaccharide deacetylase family protein [Acidobacteriaceae bacterium]|nr:polysaccharide deacetylase family protein [Acidobacteriaceae bacterium]
MLVSSSLAGPLIAGGVTLAAAAAVVTNAALLPGSQIFGQTLIVGSDPKQVALTFDDGPNDRDTEVLLDLFAEHQVRATFFMIGRFVLQRKDLARRVLAAGHVVGNHTMTHPWLAWQSGTRIREELYGCHAALQDTLGAPVRYFRPPHGARRPLVLRLARELGMQTVQWNVMGKDWLPIGVEGVLRNVRRGLSHCARRGVAANILLHDGGDRALGTDRSATVGAVRSLLAELPAQGHQFVGVDRWVAELG